MQVNEKARDKERERYIKVPKDGEQREREKLNRK
jgi:hypothetical protein